MGMSENTNKEKREIQLKKAKRRYVERMRAKGMVQLCTWIPKSILEKVRNYIERVKNDHAV